MNNQQNQRIKLPTDRSFGMFMLRGVCSICMLTILDMWQMRCDLNTILKSNTSKRASFLFFGFKSEILMNEELKRRGINYKVSMMIPMLYTSSMKALNLLSEDYNRRGC